ncbi:MAG: cyclic nucleotide-binding domain-containing protein [bacterium]|nr:cyclic nucleotide-binding domain-containing protein [bacterium]
MKDNDLNVDIASALIAEPLFSGCERKELARLIHQVEMKECSPGEILFYVNGPADRVFIHCSGSIELWCGRDIQDVVSGGFFGEEAAVNREQYISSAIAAEQSLVLVIPKRAFKAFLKRNPVVLSRLNQSLFHHYTSVPPGKGDDFAGEMGESSKKQKEKPVSVLQPLGWLAALIVPTVLYLYLGGTNLDSRAVNFVAVFSITIIMWVFRLLPEYVPAVFLILASIILGIVPTEVVLAGFSSGSFFMALSVFGIGAVLVSSGLTYRLALLLLKRAPQSQTGYEAAMILVGILLTPVLPSANGRVALIMPILEDMLHSIKYKWGGIASTRLAAALFTGTTAFSAIFLTSKSINFAVYDLFPVQVKLQFSWGYWVIAAALAGGILFLGHFFLSWLFFRNDETPVLDKNRVNAQLSVIGPMSATEWVAFGAIVFFILGAITASFHKIQPPWIGLGVLYLVLALGILSKKDFRNDIDWPFLMMLAGMISIVKTMSYLGLDTRLQLSLQWVGLYMGDNILLFILLLSLVVFFMRLVVPSNATIIILCSVFLPFAEEQGINAWVIAFVILFISDTWFMGYQSTYYIAFKEGMTKKDRTLYNEVRFILYNACLNLVRVGAVFLSIFYWKELHLL